MVKKFICKLVKASKRVNNRFRMNKVEDFIQK